MGGEEEDERKDTRGERRGRIKIKASFMTFLREQSPRKKKKTKKKQVCHW